MSVTLTVEAQAIHALQQEANQVAEEQIRLADQMGNLMTKQIALAKRSNALANAIQLILTHSGRR